MTFVPFLHPFGEFRFEAGIFFLRDGESLAVVEGELETVDVLDMERVDKIARVRREEYVGIILRKIACAFVGRNIIRRRVDDRILPVVEFLDPKDAVRQVTADQSVLRAEQDAHAGGADDLICIDVLAVNGIDEILIVYLYAVGDMEFYDPRNRRRCSVVVRDFSFCPGEVHPLTVHLRYAIRIVRIDGEGQYHAVAFRRQRHGIFGDVTHREGQVGFFLCPRLEDRISGSQQLLFCGSDPQDILVDIFKKRLRIVTVILRYNMV